MEERTAAGSHLPLSSYPAQLGWPCSCVLLAMSAKIEDKAPPPEEMQPPSSPTVLVFLNRSSGGRMGQRVLDSIRTHIPENQ